MVDFVSSPAEQRCGAARLEVAQVSGQSTVTECYSKNPIRLLTPRSRGLSVWGYLSNLGGGLVAGDETHLTATVGAGARCFLGTQSSTKVYRNPAGRPCHHTTEANIGSGALLVLAPDPVQAFGEASYTQHQEFRLQPGASLVLLDWFTSGRMARGERWQFHKLRSRNAVWQVPGDPATQQHAPEDAHTLTAIALRKPRLLFLDALSLCSQSQPLASSFRLGRFNCIALLLLTGPMLAPASQALLQATSDVAIAPGAAISISASPFRDGALVRIAGERTRDVASILESHLSFLAPLLGDNPWARRF